MKRSFLILAALLSFSSLSFGDGYQFTGTDFAPFPLNTANVARLAGVWRGENIDIKVETSGFRLASKPILWVTLSDHVADEQRRGLMYYDPSSDRYILYMFQTKTFIPVDLSIFEYSSSYASTEGLACKSGGTMLKIEFSIDSVLGEVLMIKESCY